MRGAALALPIIARYIPPDSFTSAVYLPHVILVAHLALEIARRQELSEDSLRFIEEAALLHDIGIIRVHDPELGCHGPLQYIAHGVAGREILEREGLPRHALVAERHTGVGITAAEVEALGLPLPVRSYEPQTEEEQIICFADLFFTKTPDQLWKKRTPEEIQHWLQRYGAEKVAIFERWLQKYGRPL